MYCELCDRLIPEEEGVYDDLGFICYGCFRKNLLQLFSRAEIDPFNFTPRISTEFFFEYFFWDSYDKITKEFYENELKIAIKNMNSLRNMVNVYIKENFNDRND